MHDLLNNTKLILNGNNTAFCCNFNALIYKISLQFYYFFAFLITVTSVIPSQYSEYIHTLWLKVRLLEVCKLLWLKNADFLDNFDLLNKIWN